NPRNQSRLGELLPPLPAVRNARRDRLARVASRRSSQPEITIRCWPTSEPTAFRSWPRAGHFSRPSAPLIPSSDPPRAAVDRFAERRALVFDSLPVLCRDAELEVDALGHPKPGAAASSVSAGDFPSGFNRAPRWVLVRCSLSQSPRPAVLPSRPQR